MKPELRDARAQDAQREVTVRCDVTTLITYSKALYIYIQRATSRIIRVFFLMHVADYRASKKPHSTRYHQPDSELYIWQESFLSAESHRQLLRDRCGSSHPHEATSAN